MESIDTTSHIGSLPCEVLKQIFDFLHIRDKKRIRLVCHVWRYILDEFGWPESVVFRPKLNGRSQNVVTRFLKSYRAFEKVTAENCVIKMSGLPLKDRRFPCILGEVILGNGNSQATVVNFIKFGCVHANSLVLMPGSLQNTRQYVISGLLKQNLAGFANLTKLKILSKVRPTLAWIPPSNRQKNHDKACSTFLKHARFPNLIEFEFIPNCGSRFMFKRTVANYISFLGKHAETLKILSYQFHVKQGWRFNFDLTVIPQRLRLDSFRVYTDELIPQPQQLCKKLIDSQNALMLTNNHSTVLPTLVNGCGLKTLGISCIGRGDSPDFSNAVQQILAANSETLQTVNLVLDPSDFDLNWLSPCTQMKSLTVIMFEGDYNGRPHVEFHFLKLEYVKFSLIYEGVNPLTLGYDNLIRSNGASIKHLDIHVCEFSIIDGDLDSLAINGWRWLTGCFNLEYLRIVNPIILSTIIDAPVFHHLKEFHCGCFGKVNEPRHQGSAEWIARSMPNLKILQVQARISLRALKLFLSMHGLKEVYFVTFGANLHNIERYCSSGTRKNSLILTNLDHGKAPDPYKLLPGDQHKICRV